MKGLYLFLLVLLSITKSSAQEEKISHEFFTTLGYTQPIRPFKDHAGIYDLNYNGSLLGKINYSLRYKWLGLGVEGTYFKGYLRETKHIKFDGNSFAYCFTVPVSFYLYSNKQFRFSLYIAGGISQFNTPAITRIRTVGGQANNTSFVADVENIIVGDFGARFHYEFSNQLYLLGSLNDHIFIGLFQTQLNVPQITIGLGYRL